MPDAGEITEQYRRFAERECKDYSEAYYRLASEVAASGDILHFLAGVPVTQPNLFFASIQFLTGPDEMPLSGASLERFLKEHAEPIAALMRSRRRQTNEVGRCAMLLPALPAPPLAIVEVGASAGLCLLLDKFFFDYGHVQIGDRTSPVQLRCRVSGPAPLPVQMPRIIWRHGLDLNPLNALDPDASRWLEACVWRDHPERRRRLQAAISLARVEPPPIARGDSVDDLPALLDQAPREAQLVVFHTSVLCYVTPDRRSAFADALKQASYDREIMWVSNEAPGVIPEITAMLPQAPLSAFLLGCTRFSKGARTDELLALAHPQGAELTWVGSNNFSA